MTRGKQTTALALAGAVALASGAYALGTQADDGSAAAAPNGEPVGLGFGPDRPHGPGLRPGFDDLADRLGVDEDQLRDALEDMASDRRADFAQRLADALNVDRAKVEQALDNTRPERPKRPRPPERLAAALAKELGLSTAEVREALEDRRGRPGGPDDLADALGVSEERLRRAFRAVFDDLRPPRPRFGDLAEELGVTQAQLDAALERLREQHDDLRDEFARELADRLNLDVDKVEDALDGVRPFGRRHP
jgi:AraC-like DNA-binding protein